VQEYTLEDCEQVECVFELWEKSPAKMGQKLCKSSAKILQKFRSKSRTLSLVEQSAAKSSWCTASSSSIGIIFQNSTI